MELYFLRHGLAGQHGDPLYKDDSLRPLTGPGREKMRRAALGMKALGLNFDLILSSPYLRARQTAAIVAQVYKIKTKGIHLTTHLLPPASVQELMVGIHTHSPKSRKILLVGHEPHLTELVSSLLHCDNPLNINFKKGGLCHLSVGKSFKERAVLNWLLTQKQLGLIGLSTKSNPLDPDL